MNEADRKVRQYMYRHNIACCRRLICEEPVKLDPNTKQPMQAELEGYCSQRCKDLGNGPEPLVLDF